MANTLPAGSVLPQRILPRLMPDNAFFWTSGADGCLRFLRCTTCGYFVHPPSDWCPRCVTRTTTPVPVSGRGTLHSFTVNYQPWIPDSPPYVIGLVEIVEQPDVRLTTNIVGCDPEAVRIGMKLEVVFERNDEIYLPLFRPVAP